MEDGAGGMWCISLPGDIVPLTKNFIKSNNIFLNCNILSCLLAQMVQKVKAIEGIIPLPSLAQFVLEAAPHTVCAHSLMSKEESAMHFEQGTIPTHLTLIYVWGCSNEHKGKCCLAVKEFKVYEGVRVGVQRKKFPRTWFFCVKKTRHCKYCCNSDLHQPSSHYLEHFLTGNPLSISVLRVRS